MIKMGDKQIILGTLGKYENKFGQYNISDKKFQINPNLDIILLNILQHRYSLTTVIIGVKLAFISFIKIRKIISATKTPNQYNFNKLVQRLHTPFPSILNLQGT